MTTRHLMLALAVASALAATACSRDAETTDPAADAAAAPADGAMASDTMATDPVAAPPPIDATTPEPAMGSDPMTPPGAAPAATTSSASVAANDTNADGGLSMDELPPGDMLREHFSAADTDGNGMLSQAEIDKHAADMAAKPAQ